MHLQPSALVIASLLKTHTIHYSKALYLKLSNVTGHQILHEYH